MKTGIVAANTIKSKINSAQSAKAGLDQAIADAGLKEISDLTYLIGTGYGRNKVPQADENISEISCHAMGVHVTDPSVRAIIDIGGQDAKVLSLNEEGRMVNFVMNDKCAAGTGRFLDVMANILKLDISQLETEAAKAVKPASISSTCTVFAESEVISQLASGTDIPDLVAGICQSVATRVASLAKRVGVREEVCMSGGVAQNGGVRNAMAKELGVEIYYDKRAQELGALGAAIYAYGKRSQA